MPPSEIDSRQFKIRAYVDLSPLTMPDVHLIGSHNRTPGFTHVALYEMVGMVRSKWEGGFKKADSLRELLPR